MLVHAFFIYCLWLLGGVSLQTDETETISVTNGDSVTLNTGVTEIKTINHIMWTFRFKNKDTCIAEIYKQSIYVYDKSENNEIFIDRLKLDEQIGSLTIINITKVHSGLYKVQINNGTVRDKTFIIDVYGILTVPVIISNSSSSQSFSQNCSLLCSVVNVSAVSLSWYKGNRLFSSISASDLSISLSLPLEVEYQEKSTYSCVVNNTISNKTTHMDIIQTCQSKYSQSSLLFVLLLPLLFLATVVVMTIFCRHRNYTQVKQKAQSEEEVDYTDATFIKHTVEDTKAEGQTETVYSEVFVKC